MHKLQSVSALQSSRPALRAMFEARKRVFVDLLKWDVPVIAGRFEVDQFDTGDATYLILTGKDGEHRASARLLRSDRPHILADLFPGLCGGKVPRGAHIREITRFCIEPRLPRIERRAARNQLVTALTEHAITHGIESFTAVARNSWCRQIEGFGWTCRRLGACLHHGGETLVALEILIDQDTPAALAETGIYDAACRVRIDHTGDRS